MDNLSTYKLIISQFSRGLLFLVLFLIACKETKFLEPKLAQNGILDLRNEEFNAETNFLLDGEWKFLWKKFDTHEAESVITKVPGVWNQNSNFPKFGFGTYQLKILLPQKNLLLGLKVLNPAWAYEVYADGILIGSAGKIGIDEKKTIASGETRIYSFVAQNEELRLTFFVSNFVDDDGGGLWQSVKLGSLDALMKDRIKNIFFNLFLFGSILIIGLYHLSLFFIRKNDTASLHFGLFCIVIALRTGFTGERFFVLLFPNIPLEYILRNLQITFYLAIPLFLLYLNSLFPNFIIKKVLDFVNIFGLLASLFSLFAPLKYSTFFVPYYEIYSVLIGCYFIYIIIGSVIKKEEASILLLLSFIVIFSTLINDILNSHGLIHSVALAPLGNFVFIFFQAYILSLRFSKEFFKNELLSTDLIETNAELNKLRRDLENQVIERTKELKLALEKADEANKAKSIFLANMSHEIRTPMNGVLGLTELLLTSNINPKQKSYLETIRESGQSLLSLLNDILDNSKVESGKMELNNSYYSINEIITSILSLFHPKAKEKNISLESYIDPKLKSDYLFDGIRLRQVLSNLLSNSIKFTETGSVKIEVKILEDYEQRSKIEFAILDSGIGISEENQAKLFQAFSQVHKEDNEKIYGGTGLGLSISSQIVKLMGSEILLDSKLNSGSKFYFSLELVKDNSKKVSEKSNETEKINLSKLKVLVAEDNLVNQILIREILKGLGINFKIVDNGLSAYKTAQEEKFSIIFMDRQMPEMDGIESTKKILDDPNITPKPIIIAMTANAFEEDRKLSLDSGMKDFLPKPYTPEEVRQILEKWSALI